MEQVQDSPARRKASRLTALPQPLRWLFMAMLGAAIVGPSAAWPTFRRAYLFRILFVVLWLLLLVRALSRRERFRTVLESVTPIATYVFFFAIWVVWMMASLLWAIDKLAGVRYVIFLLMMGSLALGTPGMVRDAGDLKKVLAVLALVFAAAIAVGWLEILTDFRLPTSNLVGKPERFQWASTSFFYNQNDFATYVMLWVPFLLLALFLIKRSNLAFTIPVIAAIALSSTCIIFTGSRVAVLASVVETATLLLLFGLRAVLKNRFAIVAIVILLLPLVISLSPVSPGVGIPELAYLHLKLSSLGKEVVPPPGYVGWRVTLIRNGLSVLADSYLLGVGAGNAEYNLSRMPGTERVYNLHNWWMEVLVNGGIIIFLLYVAFYLFMLYDLFKVAKNSQDGFLSYASASLFVALSGYLIGCLGPSTAIHFAPMWVIFGLALAVINIHRKRVDKEREASTGQ